MKNLLGEGSYKVERRMPLTNEDRKRIQEWIDYLRSGAHEQGYGKLQSGDNHFCCLGMACKLFMPENMIKKDLHNGLMYGYRPENQHDAPSWLLKVADDFEKRTGQDLADLNDMGSTVEGHTTTRLTFDEIADCLQLIYLEGADFTEKD